jgi:hypothetical protein
MIWLLKYWKVGLGLLLIAAVWGHGYYTKGLACAAAQAEAQATYERGMAEMARAESELVKQARETERRHAADLARIAEQHEQDKRDAEAAYERDVAGLRAGNLRLQNRWRGCEATARVSGAAAGSAEPDAAARDREESAARIVRAAREADDWIKRLQDVIRAERQ